MNLLFFGASVTAQSFNRKTNQISGYVNSLEKRLSDSVIIDRLTYGSCQFRVMGKLPLEKIISSRPDFLIVEWMTTSEKEIDPEQIIYSTSLLRKHGIGVIWLILPRQDGDKYIDKYELLRSLSPQITILDIESKIGINQLSTILRDVVHTNNDGAELYAQMIEEQLPLTIEKESMVVNNIISKQDKFNLKSSLTQGEKSLLYREVPLSFELKPSEQLEIYVSNSDAIGFWCQTNPTSPILSIYVDNELWKNISVVDRWSHYKRNILKPFIKTKDCHSVTISIVDEMPDYASVVPRLLENEYNSLLPDSPKNLSWVVHSVYVQTDSSFDYTIKSKQNLS